MSDDIITVCLHKKNFGDKEWKYIMANHNNLELMIKAIVGSKFACIPIEESCINAQASAKSSAIIGAEGEQSVEEILAQKYDVANVAKTGYKGDLFITEKNKPPLNKILVEVKKYTNPVPSAEIVKFHRDLNANLYMKAGLFISLTSRITGYANSFSLEQIYTGKKIPVIYLHTTDPNIILAAANVLFQLISAGEQFYEQDDLINKITEQFGSLIDLSNHISLIRTNLIDAKQMIDKKLDGINESIWQFSYKFEKTLSKIQKKLEAYGSDQNSFEPISIGNVLAEKFGESDILRKEPFNNYIAGLITRFEPGCSATVAGNVLSVFKGHCLFKVQQYKQKVNIHIKTASNNLNIPDAASFKGGWLSFSLGVKDFKDGIDMQISNQFENHLAEFIGSCSPPSQV